MRKYVFILLAIFVSFISMPISIYAEETGRVIGDFVTVRSSTDKNYKAITKLIYGTDVTILDKQGDWYKINYDGKNTGYMAKQYIKKLSEYTLNDQAYCNEMVKKGFDASYCPYLSYMHKQHPKWVFTPLVTNLDFYKDVVDGEEGKNCIQSTNDAYRSSDKLCDAGGFYFVNQTVNAFMLDPRNFLHEKTIFMFEDLGYVEKSENKNIVSSIFGSSSFLNTKKDGKNSYIDYYLDAGKTYKVSPVHLAARTKQEGASVETYGPVTGKVKSTLPEYGNRTLYGFYNFYNIGATNGGKPQLKGLAYAAGYFGKDGIRTSFGRPWNTRKKAIYGGANFIAGTYITAGQSTLYLQKFNVSPTNDNNRYTHQYMSNIFAPYSEGTSAKSSYEKSDILDVPYTFLIPVYKNMPSRTYQATLLSNSNGLHVININGKAIEDFDTDITEYTLYYLDTVTKFEVEAIATSVDAEVVGNQTFEFKEEKNQIVIEVTAENGDVKKYVINIIRVKDTTKNADVIAKLGVKVKSNYLYGISTNTAVSTIISSVNKISPTAVVKVQDKNGTEKKTGIIVTGDKIILKTLTSNAETYYLSVNGDLNGDGKVTIQDLLRIQKHILGTSKVSGAHYYAADTNADSKVDSKDLLRIQKHILGSIKL